MKKRNLWLLLLFVLTLTAFFGVALFVMPLSEHEAQKTPATTFKGIQSEKKQLKVLKRYPTIYHSSSWKNSDAMIPIPGLYQTKTLDDSNTITACDAMTPQGLAITDDHVFISAYCHNHEHNSVIYIMNHYNYDLLNTVVMHGNPHAGGLAFDDNFDNLWVSTTEGVAAISLEHLLNYDLDIVKKPVGYDQDMRLHDIPRSSVITSYNGFLIAGHFKKKTEGKLTLYGMDSQGKLLDSTLVSQTNDNPSYDLYYNAETLSVAKMQGIALYDNYVIISQSYGKKNSSLYIFDIRVAGNVFDVEKATYKIDFPPYLEQITIHDDQLYALFESGSKGYREKTENRFDYVLKIPFKELLFQQQQEYPLLLPQKYNKK
ncbi:hypothetical protein ACWN8V_04960 [Vagococcus elongatus]|uniref:Uncharacterized protein n=1 Tax=Vagococcus elongatus TaxID=180344 RepID=A0A430ARQ2_9ENTE|nr:hypothetical protein [Vagococcus elongatus]RSU10735.1 hypothetical protein CBF29_09120 [Vagococcus elongatus]